MKTLLAEIGLVSGSIIFWALALPFAACAFPFLLLWHKVARLTVSPTQASHEPLLA